MKNLTSKLPILPILLGIWVLFTTAYFLFMEHQRIFVWASENAFMAGQEAAIVELINLSNKCEPVPIFIQDQEVQLINVACLQGAEGAEAGIEEMMMGAE